MSSSPFNTHLLDTVSHTLKNQRKGFSEVPLCITSKEKKRRYVDLIPKKLSGEKDVVDSLDQWLESSLARGEKIEGEVDPPLPPRLEEQDHLSPRARSFLSEIEGIVEKEVLPQEEALLTQDSIFSLEETKKIPLLNQAFMHLEKTRQNKYKRMLSHHSNGEILNPQDSLPQE